MKKLLAGLLALVSIVSLHAESKPDLRTITVTGQGEVKAVPDQATYHIALSARHKVAATAIDQVNTNAQALVALLAKSGIDKKDITTTDGGVNPNYDNDVAGKIISYTANYSVAVTFRDLAKMPKIVAQVSAVLGIANLNGPSFGFSDPLQFENAALTKAVENAKSKALALAKVSGLVLKEPITVFASGSARPQPVNMASYRGKTTYSAEPAQAPMEAGEQIIIIGVEVTYAAALP